MRTQCLIKIFAIIFPFVVCGGIVVILLDRFHGECHSEGFNANKSTGYHIDLTNKSTGYHIDLTISTTPQNKVYGHVHIAKTAGSTLNRNFSLFFDNICGHKGYSYDALAVYNREMNSKPNKPPQDLYSRIENGYNRIRVPYNIMDEIGYEGCQWISHEISWTWWQKFKNWHLPMELHIPCRAPLDHLMSILNYVEKQFKCDNTWKEQIDWILTNGPGNDRFSMNLLKIPNVNVKCIPYENMINGQYFNSMVSKLTRRSVTKTIAKYRTNRDRRQENECVWTNATFSREIHNYMTTQYDYYKWCENCLSDTHAIIPH